ncbi:hypothetical protein Tco_0787302, partial [Tanacetum coccineum]
VVPVISPVVVVVATLIVVVATLIVVALPLSLEMDNQEKDKIEAKTTKNEHGNGKSVKRSQIRAKSQSQKSTKVNPAKSQSQEDIKSKKIQL